MQHLRLPLRTGVPAFRRVDAPATASSCWSAALAPACCTGGAAPRVWDRDKA